MLKSVAAIETEDTKPGVFFLSGSSGVAGDTLRYLRMLASIGHLVMCPDDFCGWPARLRHRRPAVIQPTDPANYWTNNLLYAEDSFATGELVYESCAEKYTSSNRLSVVYDATLKAKHAAMTGALLRLPDTMRRRGIVLAGNSEGAIVLGMMDDAMLELDSTLAGSPNEKNDETKGTGLDKDGTPEGTRPAARSDQHRVLAGAQLLHVPDPEQGPGLSRGYRVGWRECGWRRWEWEARELWRDFRIRARLGPERKFLGEYARREDAVRGAPGFIRQRVARGRPNAVRQRQRGPVLRQAEERVVRHLAEGEGAGGGDEAGWDAHG